MKILYFLKKLFRFIIHITNTRKIISDIGAFDICANDVQAEKIRLWFKKILDIVDVELKIEGTIREGSYLVISNHSSWLDIVVLGSTFKTTFLSKIEISRWPILGKITTAVDMLFIDRGAKDAASTAVNGISQYLKNNRNVTILFISSTTIPSAPTCLIFIPIASISFVICLLYPPVKVPFFPIFCKIYP